MVSRWRLYAFQWLFVGIFIAIFSRLVYWHVFAGPKLQTLARAQRASQIDIPAPRGLILSSDGFPLVTNKPTFLAYAYLPDITIKPSEFAANVARVLSLHDPSMATLSAVERDGSEVQLARELGEKVTQNTTWVPLARGLLDPVKEDLQRLNEKAIGFETFEVRDYPEASMAAHLLGFVGSDGAGNPKGYFGLEGFYQGELAGTPGMVRQEIDISGKPIITGDFARVAPIQGRTLVTHIDRSVQLMIETALAKGLDRYQALAGEIVVMDPHTGAIIAMAALPDYDPAAFRDFASETYRNPSISESYEPGSTFKVLVMAAGVNEKVITPNTPCDTTCNGPVPIGAYTIKTWNNQYRDSPTMMEVLKHSDNTGMVFVGRQLGKEKLIAYLNHFGFGSSTGIDLEGEASPKLRQDWKEIDLATTTFGQGIAVTSVQMLSAVSAIANGGMLYTPQVVKHVQVNEQIYDIKPKPIRRVLQPEAAKTVAYMMEESAIYGEAQWAAVRGYRLAGKTGTAQVPIAGHYDAEKTIASFVGFAPAHEPKFAMIVKLREPKSSPWASETAAPLWFNLAKEILRHYNITADLP
jgi:stage V sporulation protein D (sporulation-specific penicillin-binding protein)